MVSKQMKMKKIKTEFKAGKIKSIKKAVMVLVPLIVILFFLKILFVIKVLIFLPLLVWFYPDSTLIKSFEGGIGIERLNNPFLVGRKFYWKDLKKVKVFNRSALIHAKKPSYIEFVSTKKTYRIIYYLSNDQISSLEDVVTSNGVEFECVNDPRIVESGNYPEDMYRK